MVAVVLTTLDVPVAVEVCFNRSIKCRSGIRSTLELFSLARGSFHPVSLRFPPSWPDSFTRSSLALTPFDPPLSTAFLPLG